MPPLLKLSTHLTFRFAVPQASVTRATFPKAVLASNSYKQQFSNTARSFEESAMSDGQNKNVSEPQDGPDDWKHGVPYRIHEKNEDFSVRYEGGCHCGRVRYQLSREKPLASKYCHCTTCQRLHGSYGLSTQHYVLLIKLTGSCFQWAAIFHKEDINFTHGHHDLGWYDSSEKTTKHKLPCKVSCAYCQSPIMDEGRNMILLFPSLIKFESKEDRDKFAPTYVHFLIPYSRLRLWHLSCHMFYPMRQVDIPDGKPKWTGIDGQSDLCEDSPPDLKRKREEEKKKEGKEKKEKGDE